LGSAGGVARRLLIADGHGSDARGCATKLAGTGQSWCVHDDTFTQPHARAHTHTQTHTHTHTNRVEDDEQSSFPFNSCGTAAYVAPEALICNRKVNSSVDVYAFGKWAAAPLADMCSRASGRGGDDVGGVQQWHDGARGGQ